MIVGERITKKYGKQFIFKDYDFIVDTKEFVCFSGKSGAGKTTLLNIIGLIEPIDAGKIIIDEREYFTNKERLEYYRTKVGFIFQNYALVEGKTVIDNLKMVREEDRTDISISDALYMVGLPRYENKKIYTLSGGEQQRIAIARLLVKKCEIILADEPTGSLDDYNSAIVMDLIKGLNKSGKTVIIVSHDEKVVNLCDRVIRI